MLITFIFKDVNITIDEEKEFYKNIDKKQLAMPSEFQLKHAEVVEINCSLSEAELDGLTTGFCFSYEFTFERTVLQNVLLIFLPSSLIVMLSWISFWLDVELAAPRVALGQTSLLTLAAQFNSVQNSLPPVSTVKAIDIWMFMCILMAFASILEYALAYNWKRHSTRVTSNKLRPYRGKIQKLHQENNECCSRFRSIDFWAKLIFPLIFFIFNIIFWGQKDLKSVIFAYLKIILLIFHFCIDIFFCYVKQQLQQTAANSAGLSVYCAWNLKIKGILVLSPKYMDFSVDAELNLYWTESQLQKLKIGDTAVLLPKNIADKMHKPQFEFTNCKLCDRLIVDHREHSLALLNLNQGVWTMYSFRKKISFNCIFDLSRYPFDVQVCTIDVKQIINSHLKEHFYKIVLIVMLSWISFWLDVELAAPRVALGRISLLTLAAQFNSIQNNLPPISSVKAIDIWMFMCIFMAFASILEYALAYNCKKTFSTVTTTKKQNIFSTEEKSNQQNRTAKHMYEKTKKRCNCSLLSKTVDFWAKIIFPLTFLIFNIAFWVSDTLYGFS
uniref:Neurotransmitter-gated ion-channel transmembrane domain-containing protein n=1 Tax=Strigamia maritima TaxID=126957 RepID=T1JD87_STRMM